MQGLTKMLWFLLTIIFDRTAVRLQTGEEKSEHTLVCGTLNRQVNFTVWLH